MTTSQTLPGSPDASQRHDSPLTPRAAEQHQRRRYVYAQCTPPQRTKTQLIGRAGRRVPGGAAAAEQSRRP